MSSRTRSLNPLSVASVLHDLRNGSYFGKLNATLPKCIVSDLLANLTRPSGDITKKVIG